MMNPTECIMNVNDIKSCAGDLVRSDPRNSFEKDENKLIHNVLVLIPKHTDLVNALGDLIDLYRQEIRHAHNYQIDLLTEIERLKVRP
jgi:hypothetical protein